MPTLRPYQINQSLEAAEKSAFSFVRKEDKYNAKAERRQDLISKVGRLSAFWIIMSFIGIPLAIIFAIYESNMAQQAILTLLDPIGLGNVNNNMVALIGAGLAVFAMMVSHIFAEGLQSETDEITGDSSRKMGVQFYFAIVGLLSYIAFQYYLVQAAGEGDEEFNSFAMIAIGVAVLEILVGVLILGKSLTYLLIFFIAIQRWFLIKGMGKGGRNTNTNMNKYYARLNFWNNQNPNQTMELERSPNVARALAYYKGYNLNEETHPIDNLDTDNSSNQVDEPMTEDEVDEFINNDDDNITF